MVTRKQVPSPLPYPSTPPGEATGAAQSKHNAGMPEAKTASDLDLIDMREHPSLTRRDSDISSHGTWDSSEAGEEEPEDYVEVPKPLNVQHSQQDLPGRNENKDGGAAALPAILRPGPTGGAPATHLTGPALQNIDAEVQENPWRLESTNPFLRRNGSSETGQTYGHGVQPPNGPDPYGLPPLGEIVSSQSQAPIAPSQPPPPPPSQAPPPPPLPTSETTTFINPLADNMSRLNISDKTPAEAAPTFHTAEVLPVPQQGQPPFPPVTSFSPPAPPAFPSNNPWRKQATSAQQQQSYFAPSSPPANIAHVQRFDQYQRPSQPEPPPNPTSSDLGLLIDHPEPAENHFSRQSPPRLPPIVTQQVNPSSSSSVPETPGTQARRQRNEHYQIKHVSWFDKTAMRQSPILTQNANGPCPLLALVNALILSTPPDSRTALAETLQTREQVSLGLLLDAVFDELMSGRRGDTAHELPDVSELYSFLLALHTGMNVNPRFVGTSATLGHVEASGMQSRNHDAGKFEPTKEMRLYSTFNVPLIHGWIPPQYAPAYAAFERSAQTFEDAQNIQFVEPELEDKSRNEGLSPEEQQSLQDINTIKQFLVNWPTQLTEHGLEMISQSMMPGQIAILFRNDHFSTLYKEPRHGALMTLVTDAGYASHDEVVWESLVDVNGAASEMFSGDFRVVSHSEDARLNQNNSAGGEQGWQTVPARNQRQQTPHSNADLSSAPADHTGATPSHRVQPIASASENAGSAIPTDEQRKAAEQEDHDLALALQLQEEEEDRQRQDNERRQREQQLSEQFLENEERPPVPPRRSGRSGRQSTGRVGVNRPADESEAEAPPTYEQASSDQPYRPAGATAPAVQGNPLNAYDALRRQQSAYAQQSTSTLNSTAPPYTPNQPRRRSDTTRIRRRSSGMGTLTPTPGRYPQATPMRDPQDDRCAIM